MYNNLAVVVFLVSSILRLTMIESHVLTSIRSIILMPVSTSAKKALRKDRRRTEVNNIVRSKMRTAIRVLRDTKTEAALTEVYSSLDRAAKRNVIHKKKASRLKSRLTRLVEHKAPESKDAPVVKKAKSVSKSKVVKKTTRVKTAVKSTSSK